MAKTKIGIVGEHPNNDALAFSFLLKNVLPDHVEFSVMLKNLRGGQLDSGKFPKLLRAEFLSQKPKHVILVRDLDGLPSEAEKIKNLERWFSKANVEVNGNGLFYLAIFEMEALILSDMETVNKIYKLKSKPIPNPMMLPNPKEFLQKLTAKTQKGKYQENDSPVIFQHLDFKAVYRQHKGERSFREFADDLISKKF